VTRRDREREGGVVINNEQLMSIKFHSTVKICGCTCLATPYYRASEEIQFLFYFKLFLYIFLKVLYINIKNKF
jgi:hypothetical protein